MELHPDGYNISTLVHVFNSIPHLQLTKDGLIPLSNTTFDYGRMSYVNSLLVTFTVPLFILLLIFISYIVYLLVLRCLDRTISYTEHWSQYSSATIKSSSTASMTRFERQQPCHIIMVVCGFTTILILGYGIFLMNNGFQNTSKVIEEFIDESKNSKQTIRDWNDYLQTNSTWTSQSETSSDQHYWKKLNETVAIYTNQSSIVRMQYFYHHFRCTAYGYIGLNMFSSISMLSYWIFLTSIGCCCRYRYESRLKRFILITFAVVIFCAWMFDLHLVTTIAMADFCHSSKKSLADIAVYKFPDNNFSMPFVRYYLDCDLAKRWNLDDHKNTLVKYLEQIDQIELFSFPIGQFVSDNLNVVTSFKKNLDQTYQAVSCQHLNGIINRGLSNLCTKPIDGLTIITFSHLINFLLTLIMLFIVTFAF